jgi:hypothetical protein
MGTKTKNGFKAVEFMRQVRDELSLLIQSDKKRFHEELEQTMNNFLARRQQRAKGRSEPGSLGQEK